MTDIELKLDVEPKDNYEKAKKDLLEALKSYEKLSPIQRESLMREFFGAANVIAICNMFKQYFG